MENKMLLQSCCEQMQIPLSQQMGEQFMIYMSLLLEWNEKMNLTAITEEKEVVLKHFADCLSLVPYLEISQDTKIIDVGTGAGFPGLPVKIVCPEVSMTLLDSLQKRIGFLEEAIKSMGLKDTVCVHARAEDGGQNSLYREQFDYCVSRAVANLAVLSEYCLPFVKIGGTLAALKGPDALGEIAEAESAIGKLGGRVSKVIDVTIPFTELAHKLVFIEKVSPTPKQYPRKAGKISKKPLK
ncbi:16S rRNA (guanine(527)-N(7))-methyltransferase RsmG [Anaerotignum sp.]|uniref:16S rRNA (guanine(527)-N(7))-methyltransferase RsmG n=1 Tax=Anaerotignum sp. TaxID=2039241 RepID=UPI002714D438|nr:16S rRNA (guanine(527)-N(7))-methyltransferase RsmG [Anaerotignum sp.]